jgi:flagellar operon protein
MTRMDMAKLSNQIQKTSQKSRLVEQNKSNKIPQKSFHEVLENIKNDDKIKFSKHAQMRVDERNIVLSNNEIDRITEGVKKAQDKGVKTTLVLMDNKAFIVSVDKKTVITTATEGQLKENVFTNIDGAVIV